MPRPCVLCNFFVIWSCIKSVEATDSRRRMFIQQSNRFCSNFSRSAEAANAPESVLRVFGVGVRLTGLSRHHCHFAPPFQVLHAGGAGSSDGRVLRRFMGDDSCCCMRLKVFGEENRSCKDGNYFLAVLVLLLFSLETERASGRAGERAPPLIYFLCLR